MSHLCLCVTGFALTVHRADEITELMFKTQTSTYIHQHSGKVMKQSACLLKIIDFDV